MVHENLRIQSWHRKIRPLVTDGVIAERLHTLSFRTGDDCLALDGAASFRCPTGASFTTPGNPKRMRGINVLRLRAWARFVLAHAF